jgi:hypothetical protein
MWFIFPGIVINARAIRLLIWSGMTRERFHFHVKSPTTALNHDLEVVHLYNDILSIKRAYATIVQQQQIVIV